MNLERFGMIGLEISLLALLSIFLIEMTCDLLAELKENKNV